LYRALTVERPQVMPKGILRGFLAVAVLLVASFTAAAAARHPAEIFVEESLKQGYGILADKSLSEEQRRVTFREFIMAATDMARIGRFTLGSYADGPTAELKKFGDAFTEHDIVIYSAWLSKYKGEKFHITGSLKRAPDDVIVKADFMNREDPNGPHSEVDFQVRKRSDGRPVITDIRVEGIWLAVSQRGEFTAFLDSHRGGVGALTQHLQSVARQIFSGRKELSR
jgi:ABC-type transporter MlaC component